MVDQRAERDAALALRVVEYMRLIRSTSEFGSITFHVRSGDIVKAEVLISDHRPYQFTPRA